MQKGKAVSVPIVARSRPADDGPGEREAFLESLAPVLVRGPVFHPFEGAIPADRAGAVWVFIARDAAPREAERLAEAIGAGEAPAAAIEALYPDLLDRLRGVLAAERDDPEAERRHTVQLGGPDIRAQLPYVVIAMRRRAALAQAVEFGTALGHIPDQAAMMAALETVTVANPALRALWMQAMVGSTVNPGRVMAAAVEMAGGPEEARLEKAGFAPLADAMLAHAQEQLGHLLGQPGVFSDADLACKAVDRFRRLTRAVGLNLDLNRHGRRAAVLADLTARISSRLEAPLRTINADLVKALRRPREEEDRLDPALVLTALGGLYLLQTARRCRDSLALNAVLEQVWPETGQALEALLTRTLEAYKASPADPIRRERLDAGIKMAEIRFNAEYADILRRSRDGAQRVASSGS